MDWPKLPDGNIDWMTVFQAPDTGLVAMIDQSDTSAKLRDCFACLIDVLFPKEVDKKIHDNYGEILEETFQSGSGACALKGQKIKIRMVMMRVMNDRIKIARGGQVPAAIQRWMPGAPSTILARTPSFAEVYHGQSS